MGFYSKYDRIIRKFAPSVAKASYHPLVRIVADTVSSALSLPFPELRELPPNHLRMRIGVGNRILNDHINFIQTSGRCWLHFLSHQYCTSKSDVVELGCGCGRVARGLKDDWFEGTYVGVDIDREMVEYCRRNFPEERFQFILSPHKSVTYSRNNTSSTIETRGDLVVAGQGSKDFVYSISLYSHLLESEMVDYMEESYRILKPGGIMYMTFFCMEHVELGGRWTFQHSRGNAYIESEQFPEAAVAYHRDFLVHTVKDIGFCEVTVNPRKAQSELVARK
jgi:SAM-dependent methyltransferase